jgi:23S rRNA (pseudouridine1915-N3)-methyltransferase
VSPAVKIRLIAVGKIRQTYVAEAAADFRARLRHYDAYEEIEVAASDGRYAERAMREEGERILALASRGEPLWLLERAGEELSSPELAARLATTARLGHARLTLAVAGTYGASDALLARAHSCKSVRRESDHRKSARALVLEQLYRAAKIARNEPYHH